MGVNGVACGVMLRFRAKPINAKDEQPSLAEVLFGVPVGSQAETIFSLPVAE